MHVSIQGVFCNGGESECNAATASLVVTQCTGSDVCSNTSFVTDAEHWQGSDSPITFNHLFNGESYNASAEQPGWASPSFIPPVGHTWAPVVIMHPNISLLSGWDDHISVVEDRVPVSVTAGPGVPVVEGGEFIKSNASPDIWWVANVTSPMKNHVDECTPCAGVDACSSYVIVSQAYIDGFPIGPNFTCAMLPRGNARCV